jgi:hypothetical protein
LLHQNAVEIQITSGASDKTPLTFFDDNSSNFAEKAEALLKEGFTEITTSLERYAIRATRVLRVSLGNPQGC